MSSKLFRLVCALIIIIISAGIISAVQYDTIFSHVAMALVPVFVMVNKDVSEPTLKFLFQACAEDSMVKVRKVFTFGNAWVQQRYGSIDCSGNATSNRTEPFVSGVCNDRDIWYRYVSLCQDSKDDVYSERLALMVGHESSDNCTNNTPNEFFVVPNICYERQTQVYNSTIVSCTNSDEGRLVSYGGRYCNPSKLYGTFTYSGSQCGTNAYIGTIYGQNFFNMNCSQNVYCKKIAIENGLPVIGDNSGTGTGTGTGTGLPSAEDTGMMPYCICVTELRLLVV